MFCVTFLYAQKENNNNKKPEKTESAVEVLEGVRLVDYGEFIPDPVRDNTPATREAFFTQADLVFEGNFIAAVATYDSKGNLDRNDMYGVLAYKVERVYKGDQSLEGDTVYAVQRGWSLGSENKSLRNIQINPNFSDYLWENGLRSYGYFTPKIFFFTTSDIPRIGLPEKYSLLKYKLLKNELGDLYVQNEQIIGFDSLVFHKRKDFYNYLKQFDGYIIPELEPELIWKTAEEWNNIAKEENPECYEEIMAKMKALYKEMCKEKKKESKKKVLKNPKGEEVEKNLTLYIENVNKVKEGSKWYVKFDVSVRANEPNTYLSETFMGIVGDNAVFGTLSLNKTIITISNNFQVTGSNYDATSYIMQGALCVMFSTKSLSATKVAVTTTPKVLLHIKIEALNDLPVTGSCVTFSASQLNNVSKYALTSTGTTTYYYDKTYYVNYSGPSITSLSHTSRIAGVGEEITIQGNNFGTTQGQVFFTAANKGGVVNGQPDFLTNLDQQYYVAGGWSNTQIKLKVPSMVTKGYGNQDDGVAGSGSVKVITSSGLTSLNYGNLQIPYAVWNSKPSSGGDIRRVYLTRRNCDYDIMFTLHSTYNSFIHYDKINVIEAALNKWSDLTGLTLILERDVNNNYVFSSLSNNKNIILPINHYNNPPPDALMLTELSFSSVIISSETVLFNSINGSHIYINDNISPNTWCYYLSGTIPTNQRSFYQAFMHELGHILLLNHANDANDLMFWMSPGPGSQIINLTSTSNPVKGVLRNIADYKDVNWPSNNPSFYPPGALKATLTTTIACKGIGSIKANVSGGVPSYNYLWKNKDGNVVGTNSSILSEVPGTYTLTLTDARGCKQDHKETIPPAIGGSLTLSFTKIPANGSIPELWRANVSGGLAPYSYQWNLSMTAIISRGTDPDDNSRCSLDPNYQGTYQMPTLPPGSGCGLGVSVTDANGCKISGSPPAGKSELSDNLENSDNDILIYPNPTTGELTINNGQLTINNVAIFDVYGRKVLGKSPSVIPNAVRNPEHYEQQADGVVINISNLSTGIYFLRIETEKGMMMRKVIKN